MFIALFVIYLKAVQMADYIYDLEIQKIELKAEANNSKTLLEGYKHVYCKCAAGDNLETHKKLINNLCH